MISVSKEMARCEAWGLRRNKEIVRTFVRTIHCTCKKEMPIPKKETWSAWDIANHHIHAFTSAHKGRIDKEYV